MKARSGSVKIDRTSLILATPFVAVMGLWFAAKLAFYAAVSSLKFDVEFLRSQWRDAGTENFNRKRSDEEIMALIDKIEARR